MTRSLIGLLSRRRLAALAGAALSVAGAGCGDDRGIEVPDGSYTVWEDNLMIGIVAVDGELTAYVCDGQSEGLTINAWLHGTVENGMGTLFNSDGDELVFDHTDERTLVTLRTPTIGEEGYFATHESDPKRGVYWGEQGDWLGGWVFATADDQRGAVFKRNTGDAAFVALASPSATSVMLPDGQTMTVQKLTTPKVLGQ